MKPKIKTDAQDYNWLDNQRKVKDIEGVKMNDKASRTRFYGLGQADTKSPRNAKETQAGRQGIDSGKKVKIKNHVVMRNGETRLLTRAEVMKELKRLV